MDKDNSADAHNAAILPIMKMIVAAEPEEAGQWVLLETLCLGIGKLHGWTPRQIAVYVESMAERFATGARA